MLPVPNDVPLTKRRAWLLALALLVWWTWSLAWRPISLPDEGRYAGVARDLLVHGDWWVPRLNGLPFFHKPPLFYWIDAAAMAAFGVGPATARAAPWLGALLACLAVGWHARAVGGGRFAIGALLALSLQPLFFFGGQYANLDMLVAGCITATVVAWAHGLDAPDGRAALRAGWVAAGFGLLAKGLIGVVLPALVVLPWALWLSRGAWLRVVRRWLDPVGLVAAGAIVAPWVVRMAITYPDFLDYFVIEQHVRRFAGTHFNNPQPFWFYPAVLLVGLLPWSLALLGLRGRWREAAPEARRWPLLWLGWALAITLFFSLPRSKLVGYVLPVVPPLALLVAWVTTHGVRARRAGQAMAAVGLLLCLTGLWAAGRYDRKALREIPVAIAAAGREDPRWLDAQPVYLDSPRSEIALGAGLRRLPWIVGDWNDPAIARTDNWRKELTDAGRFDPAARARVLLGPQWTARLAEVERAWIVAPATWQPPSVEGGRFEPGLREHDLQLWRWMRDAERP